MGFSCISWTALSVSGQKMLGEYLFLPQRPTQEVHRRTKERWPHHREEVLRKARANLVPWKTSTGLSIPGEGVIASARKPA